MHIIACLTLVSHSWKRKEEEEKEHVPVRLCLTSQGETPTASPKKEVVWIVPGSWACGPRGTGLRVFRGEDHILAGWPACERCSLQTLREKCAVPLSLGPLALNKYENL